MVRLRSLLLLRSRLRWSGIKLVKVALFGPTNRTTPGVRNPRKRSPRRNSTIGITNGRIINVAALAALPGRHDADYISQKVVLSNDLISLGACSDHAPDVRNQTVQLLATFAKLRKRGHRRTLAYPRTAAQDGRPQSIVRDIGLPHRVTEVLHTDLAIAARFGSIAHHGIELTLRTALEPWHVLGEENSANGTSRYVDSSVERLQVEVTGFVPERYGVACNGRSMPLQPTGVRGNYVGGVRFKAWDPPSAMHPTIGSHNPLTFDIFDIDNGRAIGGCRYHVAHPGGRSYDTYPVNAREAEARRLASFERQGHIQGGYEWRKPEVAEDMPFTLDLRR